MLTGVQGTIKMDSGEEIKLSVSTEGSQGKWADAQDVSPGSKFALKSALTRDNAQTEMPAEEFLSKHGGMIFRVMCRRIITWRGGISRSFSFLPAGRLWWGNW